MKMKIDHITINIKDIDASINFWGGVMGLAQLPTVQMSDHTLYYFELGGALLELIQYDSPSDESTALNTSPGCYRHFAISCDDVDLVYNSCVSAGYAATKPAFSPQLQFTGFLVTDPNGVEVEVLKR